ncbi:MAG: radical SAM protein [Acidimicrobiales bacterium]|nr:radical SAM protein [Acidimicrobiales bacterium]
MAAWQASRETPFRDSVCNAPLTNLYFTVDGQVAPCWLHFTASTPRWSPDVSIADIWNGPHFTKLREAHRRHQFPNGCQVCEHNIETGNLPLAAAYDNGHPIVGWPTMLELELSNLCNLECVMCSGQLSSKIRRNREKKPPLVSPYDDTFVDQVADLLPHLQELRFNGGEPLMQPLVHKIAERVAEVRPDLKITIATNGTIINAKARRMMERCNVHVNISIDSLIPERYAEIRVNGDLAEVLSNFEEYRAYCHADGRNLAVMVNPMRMNWDEMADFVWFASERQVYLWFNTIRYPEDLALHNLSAEELSHIHDTLAAKTLPEPADGPEGDACRGNREVFERFVHSQVATWRDEAAARGDRRAGVPVRITSAPTAT